jgi:hypothetical protein
MTTATPTRSTPDPAPLVGEMVHYRHGEHCWAAAIVDSQADERAQLFLVPLPPNFPMPSAPGTYVEHDGGRTEDTWHRLDECATASRPRRRRGRRRSNAAEDS